MAPSLGTCRKQSGLVPIISRICISSDLGIRSQPSNLRRIFSRSWGHRMLIGLAFRLCGGTHRIERLIAFPFGVQDPRARDLLLESTMLDQ